MKSKHALPDLYQPGQKRPDTKRTGKYVGCCPHCDLVLAEYDKNPKNDKYKCPRCAKLITQEQLAEHTPQEPVEA